MRRLVIVGASLAGLRAAQAARAAGYDGELVMIGDEQHLPYTRPPLSKEVLGNNRSVDQIGFPCDTLEVEWRLGIAASALDRGRHRVVLADGEEILYERLIVATGCRARRWAGDGAELTGVYVLRHLDDAIALRAALDRRPRLAIVGAGFIGCEVAATAREEDLEVALIDVAATPMPGLGLELGNWCAELHRRHGVDLHLGAGVAALRGDRRVEAVELADGTLVPADVVVVGLGVIPNTEWLTDSGLQTSPALVCDGTLTAAGDPDVLGAGDVVSWPHPLAGGAQISVEHWTVAAEQGQLAGRNALLDVSDREAHVAPPYFWSDQHGVKIQAVGFPGRAAHLEVLEASEDRSRLVCAGERDGRLVGVIAINAAKRLGWYRRQLVEPPDFEQLRATVAADTSALGAPAVVP